MDVAYVVGLGKNVLFEAYYVHLCPSVAYVAVA